MTRMTRLSVWSKRLKRRELLSSRNQFLPLHQGRRETNGWSFKTRFIQENWISTFCCLLEVFWAQCPSTKVSFSIQLITDYKCHRNGDNRALAMMKRWASKCVQIVIELSLYIDAKNKHSTGWETSTTSCREREGLWERMKITMIRRFNQIYILYKQVWVLNSLIWIMIKPLMAL